MENWVYVATSSSSYESKRFVRKSDILWADNFWPVKMRQLIVVIIFHLIKRILENIIQVQFLPIVMFLARLILKHYVGQKVFLYL